MNETETNVSTKEMAEPTLAELKTEDRLIAYLKGLQKQQDRAALADLRRGLGKPPRAAMEMYPYLGRFLSHEPRHNYENAVFIVASLFAYYPDAKHAKGNLGASLRELATSEGDGVEKRFVALLNAEIEDLPNYLRQIIGLLKSKGTAVNWEQLLRDIQYWKSNDANHKYESVQACWARGFWANSVNYSNNQDTQNNSGETN